MEYILKLSISLAVVFAFYWLLLRRLTFYNWNRWYLVAYSAAAFLIPFIDLSSLLQPQKLQALPLQYVPAFYFPGTAPKASSVNWAWLVGGLALAGSLFLLLRLLLQYQALRRIRSRAVLLMEDGVRLYHVPENISPFSFGNAIFVNQELHSEAELKEIIHHEFIHVKQKHSRDILWGELLCIINWYNPFAWLIRQAIRQNLEFIADHQVLQSGIDRKQYQYLLLKVTGLSAYSIANNFSFSSLKKRIAMMNKAKTARVQLIRFLFLLPVLAVVLLAFRTAVQEVKVKEVLGWESGAPVADTIPTVKLYQDSEGVVTVITDTAVFYGEMPAEIKTTRISNQKVTITLKNGKTEVYNLNSKADRERLEKKYGPWVIPTPPAPPTPGAPLPPPPPPPVEPATMAEATEIILEAPVMVRVDTVSPPIIVTGKPAPAKGSIKEVTVTGHASPVIIRGVKDGAQPLYILDGRPIKSLEGINPDTIATVDVLKDKSATAIYGEKAKNGVVLVTTKKAAGTADIHIQTKPTPQAGPVQLSDDLCRFGGLLIINDKKFDCSKGKSPDIRPEQIESINIYKDSVAVAKYGPEGAKGVISIKLK
ncbi:MAG: TonB-dependent receptor plug domain-containing protein [Candidatus Pseudobacter hemicellulosilyticus]|uniref:TonB-dependent receptor plug domain-containing protein n=1 Tax=Candidatus Pseudobacter hemicellulosilyticus TaxID=3121375 RepID=A0AAJ5WZ14_9BACT|nr:MAG: TonB-dependent receptor plug domain-containing protein [Pseudobacter sp.]